MQLVGGKWRSFRKLGLCYHRTTNWTGFFGSWHASCGPGGWKGEYMKSRPDGKGDRQFQTRWTAGISLACLFHEVCSCALLQTKVENIRICPLLSCICGSLGYLQNTKSVADECEATSSLLKILSFGVTFVDRLILHLKFRSQRFSALFNHSFQLLIKPLQVGIPLQLSPSQPRGMPLHIKASWTLVLWRRKWRSRGRK